MAQGPSAGRWVDVAPERLARWLDNFGERNGRPVTLEATGYGVRAVAAGGAAAELHVPFAVAWDPPGAGEGPVRGPAGISLRRALERHAAAERPAGVLLVRLGGHAAGVFDGARLRASKVGHRYVQGRTAAGGRSQQRFARRRANQADAALSDAADAAVRVLLPAAAELTALVLGGDRRAVERVLADPRLAPLDRVPVEPRFLTVPDPRLPVLQATPASFRALRVRLEPALTPRQDDAAGASLSDS